jgi:hypothetical protein
MNPVWRRVCATVNPVSTGVTRWWCHSAVRRGLTGYGPTARQRRMSRQQVSGPERRPAERLPMEARARAIDGLLRSGAVDHPDSADSSA